MNASSQASAALDWHGSGVVEPARQPQKGSAPIVLSVQNISVTYGERVVLRNVACSFLEGEITAIMGPSGCGKSTLLRVLNRTLELIPQARLLSGTVASATNSCTATTLTPRQFGSTSA